MAKLSNVSADAPAQAMTPSQAVIAEAGRVEYAVDSLGRRLGVTRISASLRRRVLKALSAANGEKGQYFVMAATAACCVSIDSVPVPFPTTELQVDALIDRLDDAGLECVAITIAEQFSPPQDQDLKNS